MRLMIVGANGNLGTELRRQTRHEVVAVGRREWESLGAAEFANVGAVVHAASDLRSSVAEHPTTVLESELMVTARLLERMRDYGVPRLLYVSSCAVYGRADDTGEDGACQPLTINGQTKLLNERIIAEFCDRHRIDWESYRVFNTFGGADRFSVVSRIVEASHSGQAIRIHNQGQDVRDFVHVADVAAILLAMLERRPDCRVVNIGTGCPTRVGELIAAALEADPRLQVGFVAAGPEVHRSVANLHRLRAAIGPYPFRSVLDYIRETLRAEAPSLPSHS